MAINPLIGDNIGVRRRNKRPGIVVEEGLVLIRHSSTPEFLPPPLVSCIAWRNVVGAGETELVTAERFSRTGRRSSRPSREAGGAATSAIAATKL
jgi:hypothetical protein